MIRGALVALLLFIAPAQAQPYAEWIAHSKVPRAPGDLTIRDEMCPTVKNGWACYDAQTRTVYVSSAGLPAAWVRGQLFHEMGHDYDAWLSGKVGFNSTALDPFHRWAFERIMGLHTPWWTANRDQHAPGAYAPAEQFADAYSVCAERQRINAFTSLFALRGEYEPTPRQHRRVCSMIRRAGGWSMR